MSSSQVFRSTDSGTVVILLHRFERCKLSSVWHHVLFVCMYYWLEGVCVKTMASASTTGVCFSRGPPLVDIKSSSGWRHLGALRQLVCVWPAIERWGDITGNIQLERPLYTSLSVHAIHKEKLKFLFCFMAAEIKLSFLSCSMYITLNLWWFSFFNCLVLLVERGKSDLTMSLL